MRLPGELTYPDGLDERESQQGVCEPAPDRTRATGAIRGYDIDVADVEGITNVAYAT